jgi:uncharacterized OB-fold protein
MVILPAIDALNAPYFEGTAKGVLRLQHCLVCDRCWHPPLPRCPHCHSKQIEWRAARGTGTLYSWTDVHHSVHAATADWVPYRVVLVDLDEGPRLVAGMDFGGEPPTIGASVRVVFRPVAEKIVLPYFVLAQES